MISFVPAAIDLSRLPAPAAIEILSYETLYAGFKSRFIQFWNEQRVLDPTLPQYDVENLETDPVAIVGQAWSYLRLLDRARVNEGIKALLAPLSQGGDLDNLVGSRNLVRATIAPASGTVAAVLESDISLLRRYLLSFDAPCAGSAGRYLFDAWSSWPQSTDKTLGLWDARVNGRAVHGRRGDTDVVIIGPFGRLPTSGELSTVRAAVTDPNRAPEAVGISVLAATRVEYSVSLVIEVSAAGPAAETIREEAVARVMAAATDRILVGGEVPSGLLAGAAYGPGVVKVRDLAPVAIEADPYKVPVMTSIAVVPEVR